MISYADIFSLSDSLQSFSDIALKIYHYQYDNNLVYRQFSQLLNRTPDQISSINEIPFLPISFFKTHQIQTGNWQPEIIFRSSGTTGIEQSIHIVKDLLLYEKSCSESFKYFYDVPENYCFLALLPSYLERQDSSLVFMLQKLMKQSSHPDNGFYLYDHQLLFDKLIKLEQAKQKTLLWGVSYALLDFAENFSTNLQHITIIETGGMKGKRKEITRNELHEMLCSRFGVNKIHSEYGMAELMSQAYSQENGLFKTPPWMQIFIREIDDPLAVSPIGKRGGINIIDLANVHSCSFIATQDLGIQYCDGSFEISGRFDTADVRGCNLLIEDI